MYGNSPFDDSTGQGPPAQASSNTTLSADEKRAFRRNVSQIESSIAKHLPQIYGVSSTVAQTPQGIRGLITIQPPLGQPIGTNLLPPTADGGSSPVDDHVDIVNDVVATVVLTMMERTNSNPPQRAG